MPIPSCLSGLSSLLGYDGEPPLGMSAVAYGDANASIHALSRSCRLVHRKITGEGQTIDLPKPDGEFPAGEALMDYQMNGRAAGPRATAIPSGPS